MKTILSKQINILRRAMPVLVMLCLLAVSGPADLSAQLNNYESQVIREKILNDFHILIDTWTEELYFEMYQLGDMRSKGIMSQGEFAQRMVDLAWKPTLKPLQNEKVDIIYRNFASIQFDQQFENKVNQTQTIWKRMIFATVLENKTWKFDLKQLINIPFEGKNVDPEAERKAAEKAKAEAEKKAQEEAEAARRAQAEQEGEEGQAGEAQGEEGQAAAEQQPAEGDAQQQPQAEQQPAVDQQQQ